MSRSLLLLMTLTLSTIWLPYQADAYVRITTPSGTPVKWTSMPITYYYNHNGFTQVPESTMVGIIQAAFDAWALSSCVKLSSSYLGKTQMVWNQSDRNNVLIWNKGIPSTQYPNALALTVPNYTTSGEMGDADIIFNANYKWSTTPPQLNPPFQATDPFDVVGTTTHELGHLLGLGHSADQSAAMASHANPGLCSCRSLKQDDVDGICAIYPKSSGPGPGPTGEGDVCTSASPCPSGLVCTATDPNNPTQGKCFKSCQSSSDCTNGEFCQGNPTKICACRSDAECPAGSTCNDFLCSPPAGGNKQQGEACDAVSNLCANGLACVSSGAEQRCRVLCSTESDCVTGEACKSVSAGQNVCICETDADCRGGKKCSNFQCIDGTPAGGGDGEPCRSDGSCQNGLTCITHPTTNIDTCVKDCQGAAVCPTGQVCDSQLKACVPDTTKPGGADQGQPCNTSTPCKAGLICIGQGNAALCYKECDGTVGSCPTGTKCTPVSGSNDSFCKAVAPTGCNPACPTGQTCQNGTCVNDTPAGCNPACPTGQTCQNGTCVNTNTSGCDPACSVGQICENGTCVFAPQCDANTACAYGQECINGICELKDETPIKPPKAVGCTTLHTAPTSLPLIVFGLFLLVLVRRRRWLG